MASRAAHRFDNGLRYGDDANVDGGCPNGPDEDGNWPCDPKGYFGVLECQVCGRIGVVADETFEAGGKEAK